MPGKTSKQVNGTQRLPRQLYETELYRLQGELVKMQEWTRSAGASIVALPAPTERERTQWYLQRYVDHLLSTIPYHDVRLPELKLPPRPASRGYVRAPRDMQAYVPDHAAEPGG